jgi:DNA-binding NarL/FixJ family response regulator
MARNRGLPKALQAEEEILEQQSPEEFAKEFFGDATEPQDAHGLPSLTWIKEQFQTKSAAIRYLISQGHATKHIAKHLGVRYQHVRNVATNKLKRGPNEPWTPKDQRKPTT